MNMKETRLARWSRLKRAAAERRGTVPSIIRSARVPLKAAAADPRCQGCRPAAFEPKGEADKPVDLASLPDIDSISASTDIRAFLRAGVPTELTNAALRRAWLTDPSIRNFVGLAENQWDFTDPSAIPGFGRLEPAPDLAELAAKAVGNSRDSVKPPPHSAAVTAAASPQDLSMGQHSASETDPEPPGKEALKK